jgi:hypothetical protein
MKFDWQHVALMALGLAGAALCVWRPAAAQYVAPVLSSGMMAALFKTPPGGSAPPDPPPVAQ